MNRIAVITDIHGNLPALEASLQAIEALGVDSTYCGGDLVGYGPHPNEVCRLIEERGIPAIFGKVLDDYDDVPIRSHILTLAHKRTRDCLRREECQMLEARGG